MATTYTWHSGSACLNSLWIKSVPVLPDELFSSWLVRAALEQGCDPLVLTGAIWPRWRAWTRDLDRGLSVEQFEHLIKVSGIEASKFLSMTLRHVVDKITNNNFNDKAVWPWLLAQGIRNRKRQGGLQFCPSCIANDEKPYYRVQWRFAWHTGCVQCGCQLIDRCQKCGSAVEPHRLLATHSHIAICATCNTDLRKVAFVKYNIDAINFQNFADKVILKGCSSYDEQKLKIYEWFNLAKYFVILVRRVCITDSKGLFSFFKLLNIDLDRFKMPVMGLAFELLPVNDRAELLAYSWKLLHINANDFLKHAKNSSLNIQSFKEPKQELPPSLIYLEKELPLQKREKRKEKYKKKTLARFLGKQ